MDVKDIRSMDFPSRGVSGGKAMQWLSNKECKIDLGPLTAEN